MQRDASINGYLSGHPVTGAIEDSQEPWAELWAGLSSRTDGHLREWWHFGHRITTATGDFNGHFWLGEKNNRSRPVQPILALSGHTDGRTHKWKNWHFFRGFSSCFASFCAFFGTFGWPLFVRSKSHVLGRDWVSGFGSGVWQYRVASQASLKLSS